MKDFQQLSTNSFFEQHERSKQSTGPGARFIEAATEHAQLDTLIESGFKWDEALKLLTLREHLYQNKEIRQLLENDNRMQFARWLYQQGEMSEE
jgi:hypothetical protein